MTPLWCAPFSFEVLTTMFSFTTPSLFIPDPQRIVAPSGRLVVFEVPSDLEATEQIIKGGYSFRTGVNAEAGLRIIEGIATTDAKDKQREVIAQDGIDWKQLLESGWLNNNHGSGVESIVGVPLAVTFYAKGSQLPDGRIAEYNCHWVKGYLLEGHPPADGIWSAALSLQAMQEKGLPITRRLGFSVEGDVVARDPSDRTYIRRSSVTNLAVTHVPVNDTTSLRALVKSLMAKSSNPEIEPLRMAAPITPPENILGDSNVSVETALAEIAKRRPDMPIKQALQLVYAHSAHRC